MESVRTVVLPSAHSAAAEPPVLSKPTAARRTAPRHDFDADERLAALDPPRAALCSIDLGLTHPPDASGQPAIETFGVVSSVAHVTLSGSGPCRACLGLTLRKSCSLK